MPELGSVPGCNRHTPKRING